MLRFFWDSLVREQKFYERFEIKPGAESEQDRLLLLAAYFLAAVLFLVWAPGSYIFTYSIFINLLLAAGFLLGVSAVAAGILSLLGLLLTEEANFLQKFLGFLFLFSFGITLFCLVLIVLYWTAAYRSLTLMLLVLILFAIYIFYHSFCYLRGLCGFKTLPALLILFTPPGLFLYVTAVISNQEFGDIFSNWFRFDSTLPVMILRYLSGIYFLLLPLALLGFLIYLFLTENKLKIIRKWLTGFIFFTFTLLAVPGAFQLLTYPTYRLINSFSFEILGQGQLDRLQLDQLEAELERKEYSEAAEDNYRHIYRTVNNFKTADEFDQEKEKITSAVEEELEGTLSKLPGKVQCVAPRERREWFRDIYSEEAGAIRSIPLTRAAGVYARQLHRAGNPDKALTVFDKFMGVNNCIFQAYGGILDLLITVANQGIILENMGELVEKNMVPAEAKNYYDLLKKYDQSQYRSGITNAYTGEYLSASEGWTFLLGKLPTSAYWIENTLPRVFFGPEELDRIIRASPKR